MVKFKINRKDLITYIIIIIIAIIMTMSNYIFIGKDGYLSTDVAVWTNIAKGMEQGKIIYKDIFDHKGPLLYFFYYLGYIIANQFGIWILDFIFNTITIFMIYLISKLIINDKRKFFIVIAVNMLFMMNLCYENPCTESIALPFILIALYEGLKFIINSNSFKKKETILTSISFSIVLLLRQNLLLFWVLFYVYLFIKLIKEKKIKQLLKIVICSILGVSIFLISLIIYFIKNNAFNDFINGYLIFNLKYLSNKEVNIIYVINYFISKTNFIIVIIGAIYLALINIKSKIEEKDIKMLRFSFLYYIIAFYLVIMPQRCYNHYAISIIPTLIIPLAIVIKYIKSKKINNIILLILSCVFIINNLYVQANKIYFYNIMSNLQETLKYKINLIKKEDNVLVIGNNTQIYLMINRQYNGKYFYQMPIGNNSEEIADEILNDIKENSPIFIIDSYGLKKEQKRTNFEQQIKKMLDENYLSEDGLLYEKINKD